MRKLTALMLPALLLLAGCAARPLRVMPAQALATVRAHPEVAAWLEAHSAPRVLEGMNPAAALGLHRYKPVAMVDLAKDGLLVRFDSALGPRPKRLHVVVDRESGEVIEVVAP